MRRPHKLNEAQTKAIANLFLEIGKWLFLVIVLGSLFTQDIKIEFEERIVVAAYAFIVISVAVWILREVKNNE